MRDFRDIPWNEPSAEVISSVARHPGQLLMQDIALEFHRTPDMVSKVANGMAREGWVGSDATNGKLAYHALKPLAGFWEAYNRTVGAAHELPDKLTRYFQDAVEARQLIENVSGEQSYYQRRNYLGDIALLGQEADLYQLTDGEWFRAEPGWRALIEIRASQLPKHDRIW